MLRVIAASIAIGIGFSLASFITYQQRHNTNNERFCALDTALVHVLTDSLAKVPKRWAFNHPATYENARVRTRNYVEGFVSLAPCSITVNFPPDPLDYPGGNP